LLETLSERNNDLAGFDQQDAHELFQVMLSILTDEAKQVNLVSLKTPATGLKSIMNGIAKKSDPRLSHRHHTSRSEISGFRCPLQGTLGSQLICQVCNNPRPVRHQQYLDLSLPIPDNITPGRNLLLQDCIAEFLRGEQIDNVECPACTVNATTSKIKDEVDKMGGLKFAGRAGATATTSPRTPASPSTAPAANGESSVPATRTGNRASNTSDDLFKKDLLKKEVMLNKLNRCCMIGESDSFMMDLDVDNLNNLDVKNNQGRSTAVNFAESNENGSSNGYHNSDNPDRAAKKPTVVTSEEPSTTVDQHLIERIRTSVRKSMYLMQLPEMLCVQISRLVYNPMTGRKMKLPQHVRFDTKLDMSSFQMTPEQAKKYFPPLLVAAGAHELLILSMYKSCLIEMVGSIAQCYFHIAIVLAGQNFTYPPLVIGFASGVVVTLYIYQFAMTSGMRNYVVTGRVRSIIVPWCRRSLQLAYHSCLPVDGTYLHSSWSVIYRLPGFGMVYRG
jgi:hypothetical protein